MSVEERELYPLLCANCRQPLEEHGIVTAGGLACRITEPDNVTYIRVFQDRYSGEQTLVTIHPDGTVELATREKPWHSWGPPHELKETETHD